MQIKRINEHKYIATEKHNGNVFVSVCVTAKSAMTALLSRLDSCGYFSNHKHVRDSVHKIF